ncbi:uncharacterized protein STEHIDRAFT_159217 [Stereum hirsutum FP-91666 SS1]|uniref:uncharacterized protein n=1 Tax=Stereum hirsutum (strain FP-91666) TaxID=721885 RepID=UPI000444A22C|nr:uncharacterized protein STEHIDRAFT_159217 [Stereum hirsutum FP-91666 SS1]EIM84550.1 hypothetical protein STEHIDRAFT_159217 [Stereum hirsutum FP-91666 SS1]
MSSGPLLTPLPPSTHIKNSDKSALFLSTHSNFTLWPYCDYFLGQNEMRGTKHKSLRRKPIKQQDARNRPRKEFQEIFEVCGYDARDAAQDWWVQWGVLGEIMLGMTQENG